MILLKEHKFKFDGILQEKDDEIRLLNKKVNKKIRQITFLEKIINKNKERENFGDFMKYQEFVLSLESKIKEKNREIDRLNETITLMGDYFKEEQIKITYNYDILIEKQ